MSRAADIERIIAHIGATDLTYREFEPPPDTDLARASWSLVHSATGPDDGSTQQPMRPPAPEQRPAALRERVAERAAAPARAPESAPDATAPPESPPPAGRARPLQQVFARLGGRAAGSGESSSGDRSATPLAQVFKRLS